MPHVALSIAGSDPTGGAGIQADLKTFQSHGVYGTAVISLITVQDTAGVQRVELLAPELVAAQLETLIADLPPAAAKTGALGGAAQVEAVAAIFARRSTTLVVDPIFASTSGATLLDTSGLIALRKHLLPLTTLVTPNLYEAAQLAQRDVDDAASMRDAAKAIADFGARAVLVKGGHSAGPATDWLYVDGVCHELPAVRIENRLLHGLGCALSAAITARLARGESVWASCSAAKAWLTRAIENAPDFGGRRGPVRHAEPAL